MKKKDLRKPFRKKYYFISNTTSKNLGTGNACVAKKDITNFDRDFLYQYIDADLKYHNIVISKEKVLRNLMPCAKLIETLDGDKFVIIACYLIKLENIFKYGKEI